MVLGSNLVITVITSAQPKRAAAKENITAVTPRCICAVGERVTKLNEEMAISSTGPQMTDKLDSSKITNSSTRRAIRMYCSRSQATNSVNLHFSVAVTPSVS